MAATATGRRDFTGALALAGFSAIACLYFGLRVALREPMSYVGTGVDPEIFIWSFAWWPHAILHGANPFVTHAIWAPTGINLAWTTSVPGLALLFAPLTLLVGPVAAFDTAAVLMPAAAAWTCFLLCRHLTGLVWPSLVGGYVFGFSSYMLGQQEGHLHLTSVFLIPLIALALVARLEGKISGEALVVRLAVLIALQISFSTEVFFTLALALATALVIAFASAPELRQPLTGLVPLVVGAYGLAGLITSPLVYYTISGFDSHSINAPRKFAGDLLNLVVPTTLSLASANKTGVVAAHFLGNNSERGAYLGLPVLVTVALFARRRWRASGGRFLLLSLAAAVIAMLGASLRVDGQRLLPLPLSLLDSLPLFDNVLPARFSLFVSLVAAVIVALWTAAPSRPRWLRYALPTAVVIALLPRPGSHAWITEPDNPGFIAHRIYRACLSKGETVLVFPFGSRGDSMLWQAESGFWFRLAGGYLSPSVPREFRQFRVVHPALAPSTQTSDILALVRTEHAQAIIVDGRDATWRSRIPGKPRSIAGVLLYQLTDRPIVGRAGICNSRVNDRSAAGRG